MHPLPPSESLLVIRTDFSDDNAWAAVRSAIGEPDEDGYHEDYDRGLQYVDDRGYRGATMPRLIELLAADHHNDLIVAADDVTIASPDLPLLLADLNALNEQYGRTFRCVPSELASIEVNLSIGNMDFFEFADSADDDGIFRGFGG
ncbi:MAG TPA: hypothetical protein VE172_06200 [Stackebrandtia sp.]|uniref:DUF6924 domain-containing protein n=1 Tax=Stackebrandtia sp. TaxID=2023065 RepID=UPI002D640AA5|nr:hypothetical protein [Stackebrandtia sp.]HZE38388.1 hypothetical protein [Stackebrandtia sp.]